MNRTGLGGTHWVSLTQRVCNVDTVPLSGIVSVTLLRSSRWASPLCSLSEASDFQLASSWLSIGGYAASGLPPGCRVRVPADFSLPAFPRFSGKRRSDPAFGHGLRTGVPG